MTEAEGTAKQSDTPAEHIAQASSHSCRPPLLSMAEPVMAGPTSVPRDSSPDKLRSSRHLPMNRGFEASWRKVASTHSLQDLLEDDSCMSQPRHGSLFWHGLALTAAGAAFGLVMLTWLLASAMGIPALESWGLRWMQVDRYYCLLIPLTVPATVVAVFINWVSLKLFKHNS